MDIIKTFLYVFSTIGVFSLFHQSEIREHTPKITSVTKKHVEELKKSFTKKHRKRSQFWLSGKETLAEERNKVEKFAKKIRATIDGISVLSKDIEDIQAHYQNFTMCVYKNGILYQPGTQKQCKKTRGVPLFSVIPYSEYRQHHNTLHARFFYQPKNQTTFWTAYTMTNTLFRGVLIHELGHLTRAEKKLSTTNIEEEARMHNLELQVMDEAVNGQMTHLYETIYQRANEQTPDKVFATLQERDFELFHNMLGRTEKRHRLIFISNAQFLLGLGLYVMKKKNYGHHTLKMYLNLFDTVL